MPPAKRVLLSAFAMLIIVGSSVLATSPAGAAEGFFEGSVVRATTAEPELLDTINRTRAEYGLSPLSNRGWGEHTDYLNCIAAQNAGQGGLEHYPSECGQSFVEAEILAARYSSFSGGSVNTLVKQWNESAGHRRIMLAEDADYANVGVFCIGHTSWAIAWIGDNDGRVTQNYTHVQDIPGSFFTDNDYACQNSAPAPIDGPLGAYRPADTLEALVTRSDFDRTDADVLRLYRAFFKRDADIDGANYWLGLNHSGASIDEISYQFAASEEFQNTYGSVSNRRYLEILYGNVLGRQPDADGFNYWLGTLQRSELNRGGVVRWIAANDEFVNRFQYGGE